MVLSTCSVPKCFSTSRMEIIGVPDVDDAVPALTCPPPGDRRLVGLTGSSSFSHMAVTWSGCSRAVIEPLRNRPDPPCRRPGRTNERVTGRPPANYPGRREQRGDRADRGGPELPGPHVRL